MFFSRSLSVMRLTHLREVTSIHGQLTCFLDILLVHGGCTALPNEAWLSFPRIFMLLILQRGVGALHHFLQRQMLTET